MKIINLELDYPSVAQARKMLLEILTNPNKNANFYKIIHGYGSSGVGGQIKKMVVSNLKKLKNDNIIKDFLPGEAINYLMGYDNIVQKYINLLKQDPDYKRTNEGITYVFIWKRLKK